MVRLEIAGNLPPAGSSVEESQKYTRWLATHHYENFSVATFLLPRALRQHFYNIYAYCRWSDDLADEVGSPEAALELLDWWEEELCRCYAGNSTHPVFIALRETIRRFDIPQSPFSDLLKAFRSDQTVTRYPNWESVIDYCRYSANPVGCLVLYLGEYRDTERQTLSGYTCTALQLANFWQDVSRDLEKGRIYIPLDMLSAYGLTEADIIERRFDERYAGLMRDLIARTRDLFDRGMPLTRMVSRNLRIDIQLFSHGGLAVLDAIESVRYNTLQQRPHLSGAKKLRLIGRAVGTHLFSRTA